jgi:hypothetical protein
MDNDPRSSWELRDIHIREVLAIELRHRDRALEVQAREYERRLNTLNHENERILAAAALSVSTEKFDGFIRQLNDWQTTIEQFRVATETTSLDLAKAQVRLRSTVLVWMSVLSVLLSAGVAFTRLWGT